MSQQRGEPGDQRQTESDRDGEAAKRMKAANVKRDSSVFGGATY